MTLAETERFASLLWTKQMELSASLRNRDEIVIEKMSDALDEVQLMGDHELAIRNLDRDSNILRQIRRARSRIAKGTYGACLHCAEDISVKRLAALPWAAFCVKCQEKIDNHEIKINENIELHSLAA